MKVLKQIRVFLCRYSTATVMTSALLLLGIVELAYQFQTGGLSPNGVLYDLYYSYGGHLTIICSIIGIIGSIFGLIKGCFRETYQIDKLCSN